MIVSRLHYDHHYGQKTQCESYLTNSFYHIYYHQCLSMDNYVEDHCWSYTHLTVNL